MRIQTQSEVFAWRIARTAGRQEDLDDYRWERQRQQDELEKTTGGWEADEKAYFDRNKPLITYKDWMKGKSIGPGEQAARAQPISNETHTPHSGWGADQEPAW